MTRPARRHATRKPLRRRAAVVALATLVVAAIVATVVSRSGGSSTDHLANQPDGVAGHWRVVAADAFNSPDGRLDRKLWGYGLPFKQSGNDTHVQTGANTADESDYERDDGAQLQEHHGLVLTAKPSARVVDGHHETWVSGAINSHPADSNNRNWTASGAGFAFNPSQGTFAIQAVLQVDPDFRHSWPAFWVAAMDYVWPPEVDVTEFLPTTTTTDVPQAHVHFEIPDHAIAFTAPTDPTYTTTMHTYTAVLGPAGITFYVDGHLIGSVTNKKVLAKVLDHRFYLMLNEAVVGSAAAPMHLRVRSVTAWEAAADHGGLIGGVIAAGTRLGS